MSQRQLAARAGTSQSAVARYEAARVLPDIDTLYRLLFACGQRLELSATRVEPESLRQLDESIAMGPRRRVERNRRVTSLAARASSAHAEGRVRPLTTAHDER